MRDFVLPGGCYGPLTQQAVTKMPAWCCTRCYSGSTVSTVPQGTAVDDVFLLVKIVSDKERWDALKYLYGQTFMDLHVYLGETFARRLHNVRNTGASLCVPTSDCKAIPYGQLGFLGLC